MKYLIVFVLATVSACAGGGVLIKASCYVISRNEGFRAKPYLCSNSHLTVGYGHKIVNRTKPSYTRGEALALLEVDLKKKLKLSRRLLPDFDTYPVCIQVAILDGVFRGDLSGSPKTLRLMRQGKWIEASKEYLDNLEYRKSKKKRTGVYKRMDRNASKYRAYGESV